MVSRRNFFSITIMMIVLFFLFQFSMVMRDGENVYDENTYLTAKKADQDSEWKQAQADITSLMASEEDYVLFLGEKGGLMETAVSRWCSYTKRNVVCLSSITEYVTEEAKEPPEVLILESEFYAEGENLERIKELQSLGTIVIFGCLEDTDRIAEDQELKEFLGIKEISGKRTEITGVKIFEGFLLGGESIYETSQKEEEKKRQDFELNVPWYKVGSGTKTYMVGLKKNAGVGKEIENEDLPTLIWRNGIDGGSVFAVCGNFLKDSTAIGILDGMIAESNQYTIYPIINAQNLSIVDFPGFSDENRVELQEKYSRSVSGICRDIIWPALISISEQSNRKMTCFIQPQADYTDQTEPDSKDLIFYLKQFKEQGVEAGISLQYKKADSLAQKLNADQEFFEAAGSGYRYGAAYVQTDKLAEALEVMSLSLLKDTNTLMCEYTEKYPIVSYCDDSTTLQEAISDGMDYSYRDDFRMRSIQSALGYTNVFLNLQDIFWPEEEDSDGWEKMQEKFASNLLTYWKDFSDFTSTTLSESNDRVRTFLKLDYSYERKDQKILLQTTEKGAWFILRTHGEDVDKVEGGESTKLEENAYLIKVQDTTVLIELKGKELHYYDE